MRSPVSFTRSSTRVSIALAKLSFMGGRDAAEQSAWQEPFGDGRPRRAAIFSSRCDDKKLQFRVTGGKITELLIAKDHETGLNVLGASVRVRKKGRKMRGIISAVLVATLVTMAMTVVAKAGSLLAEIDISSQTMTVSEYGRVIYRWKVSTARRGYHTPRGSYRPIRLNRMWYSHKYHNSPMPHSVFFHGGYAIHGTYSTRYLGRPASHGCVRLHPSDAATFFAMVKEAGPSNTRIVVTN